MIWIPYFLLNHDSSLLFRLRPAPNMLILGSLGQMCSWDLWACICRLSLHLWSLGDTLLAALCHSSPTSTDGLRQESCGSLATVLNIQAVAARSPARGKFATPGPASPGCAPACGVGLSHRGAASSTAGTCSFLFRHPGRALYCFLSGYKVIKFTEADCKEVGMYYHALWDRLLIKHFFY